MEHQSEQHQPDNNKLLTGIIGLTNKGSHASQTIGALVLGSGCESMIDYFEANRTVESREEVGIEGLSRMASSDLTEAFERGSRLD